MAVTSTNTYTVTRDQIIEFAFRKCGALNLGDSLDSTTLTTYADPLNMMIKHLITVPGVRLWTIDELTLTLVASVSNYVLGPAGALLNNGQAATLATCTDQYGVTLNYKPLKLFQAWLRNTTVTPNNDVPLQVISQHNYNEFGSKFSPSTPNSVYMDVGREVATVKMYTTPDTTAASTYKMHLLTQRQIYDMPLTASSTTNFDFPVEWFYPLGYLFAAEIMLDLGVEKDRRDEIRTTAASLLQQATAQDIEYNSVYMTPDLRWRRQ